MAFHMGLNSGCHACESSLPPAELSSSGPMFELSKSSYKVRKCLCSCVTGGKVGRINLKCNSGVSDVFPKVALFR